MRIHPLILFVVFVWISSCTTAPTTKPVTGPDGSEHWLVTCTNVEKCYADARAACHGNYRIVNNTADTSGMTSVGGGLGYGYGFGQVVTGAVTTRQKMLVKCETSAPSPTATSSAPSSGESQLR